MSDPTTVPILTADQWAQRLLRLYPNKWTGDSAKVAGGVLYSLFNCQGNEFNFLQNGLDYVLNACRIATASDIALDAIANDYFGAVLTLEATVVRKPGEPDDSFRKRIYANLLQGGGTREDIIRVCELLTGQTPRITEPWYIMDCAACDAFSYTDIDTVANPARAGDDNLPYVGFVESVLPSFGDQGNNPVYCVDFGLAADRSFIIDPQPTWFLGEQELYAVINRVRMANTSVGVRFQQQVTAGYARGATRFPSANSALFPVSMYPPCASTPVVLICPSWNSAGYSTAQSNESVDCMFSAAAPGDASFDVIIAPSILAGFGFLNPQKGDLTGSIRIPNSDATIFVSPNWNTTIWATDSSAGSLHFEFSNPAPGGALVNYGSFSSENSGKELVSTGDLSGAVVFDAPIVNPYQLMLMPGWNTEFEFTKTENGFSVVFGAPPPSDSFFIWGIFDQPL